MLVLATAMVLALPSIAQAEAGAVDWILGQTSAELIVQTVGEWKHSETRLISVDSLTYSDSKNWPYFYVPAKPSRFVALLDRAEDRVSKAVLVFDHAPPVCGKYLATMPVDTGTRAFLTPVTAKAIGRLGAELIQQNSDLYADFMEPQIKGWSKTDRPHLPAGSTA